VLIALRNSNAGVPGRAYTKVGLVASGEIPQSSPGKQGKDADPEMW
jgi:hypothetical protein